MNLSYNQISGQIPNLSLEFTFSPIVDLSSNKLSSRIPKFLFEFAHLDLSKNTLSSPIFSLCEVQNGNLNFLDLSNNRLSGQFPNSCWMYLKGLRILNLANNHFHGTIPSSVGFLHGLVTLDLGNNNFSGERPSSLNNCELIFLNLGDNALTEQIPMWLGTSYPNLIILVLRSNHFNGSIPIHLCHLAHLQVLDLALNQILGSIPKCLNNLHTLTQKDSPNATIVHSSIEIFSNLDYEISHIDRMFFMWKGKEQIDMLQSLDFLDLSKNQLSGGIPSSLSHIDRLSVLDLSNNNLSGKIRQALNLIPLMHPHMRGIQIFVEPRFQRNVRGKK
ncbi:receptor-like protein eix2 [Quercus suber]|uniref:Receptor-like protein eix2 n=1 Tax=Quercus suber TaxID=58331 RepID=A0AAW0JHQ5_QUESU